MVVSVALAALSLRAGLSLRRARRTARPRDPALRAAHLRIARPAVVLVLVGFLAGPLSAVLLRDWRAFGTFHGALGVLTVGLFAAAAVLGRRLEAGDEPSRRAHALLGALAVLAAAVAAVAGFVLLP